MSDGPQSLKPEDDWVRGNRLQLGRRLAEADAHGDAALWAQLYLGDAAIKLMRGVAERADIAKVMGYLIAQCEQDVQQGARDLLALEDTGSPAYRKLHFDTRVSAAILGRINQLVHDGQQAAALLDDSTQGP